MKTFALITSLLLAGSAAADPASDAAAKSEEGKKAFADGKYADAIAAFRAAHELQPDPKLLYAIAQAQRMAGDCAAAIATYEDFIRTKADDKLVEYSQANIDRCKEQLAKQPPKEPKPPRQPPPPEKPIVQQPPPREGASWTTDWLGHGLVAGGVAGTVIGLVVWNGARGDAKAVNDATDHEAFLAARDAADGAVTRQRIGIGVAIVGVAAIAGGIVHYKLSGKREVMVAGTPAPGGGSLMARVRF